VVQAGQHRLARVESLRAVAALAVATAHAFGLSHNYANEAVLGSYPDRIVLGGGHFVFLFFGLSGYLLFWPFASHYWGDRAPIDLKRYAINRAVRILPLYYFVVVFLLIVQEHGATADYWWRFPLMWQNYTHATIGKVDGALWSVIVEVHFYILLPFLAVGVARVAGRSRARAATVLGVLGGASLAVWLAKVTAVHGADRTWSHNIPATFMFFVPGMWLALLRLECEERPPRWLRGRVATSSPWVLGSIAVWLVVFYDYQLLPLAGLASFLLIGAVVLPLGDGPIRRVLDWRPLAALGVVSYSLYVWHTRVMDNLRSWDPFPDGTIPFMAITLALAIVVAIVSYRMVEAPFLRLRRRWSTAAPRIDPQTSAEPAVTT
jgi:peptidoglycan/LPS O-acetylase OafA/YrhL